MRSTLAVLVLVLYLPTTLPADPGDVLVTVNGEAITRADLDFELLTNGVPEGKRAEVERRYLESLVDARLLSGFLRKRKAEADPKLVDDHVARIRRAFQLREMDPDTVLASVGWDDAALRRKLELPVAWEAYSQQVVRPADVRKYWEQHRPRFDGTRLRASQILRTLPADADDTAIEAAKTELGKLRERIAAGELDFAEAAREHSDAPTARNGGDVGWFPYRGKMPASFTDRVFGLEKDEMTEPFATRFGVHLVRVTDVDPGTYSLEDVRTFVFDALAREVREKLIEKERESATIEWADDGGADR